MNLIKRKYVSSLVFDLVLLLVGSGMLYRLSSNLLLDNSVTNLVYVIINAAILGAVVLDIVFEAVMYNTLKRISVALASMSEEE